MNSYHKATQRATRITLTEKQRLDYERERAAHLAEDLRFYSHPNPAIQPEIDAMLERHVRSDMSFRVGKSGWVDDHETYRDWKDMTDDQRADQIHQDMWAEVERFQLPSLPQSLEEFLTTRRLEQASDGVAYVLQDTLLKALKAIAPHMKRLKHFPNSHIIDIETGDDEIHFTTENGKKSSVRAKVEVPFQGSVDGETLYKLTKLLPAERVDLRLKHTTLMLNVRCAASVSNIKGAGYHGYRLQYPD